MDVGHIFGDMTLDDKVSALRKVLGSTDEVMFRCRLRGFDRDEVRAFIGKIAGD